MNLSLADGTEESKHSKKRPGGLKHRDGWLLGPFGPKAAIAAGCEVT